MAVKNSVEAAKFLTDLLSSQEVEMLAKRLKIAGLLIKGSTYEENELPRTHVRGFLEFKLRLS